jgi:predicted permease
LVGAGLLPRTSSALRNVRPGFDSGNVLTLRFSLPESRYPAGESRVNFVENILERVESLGAVEGAAAGFSLPLATFAPSTPYTLKETDSEGSLRRVADWRVVTPGFLGVLGTRLVEGRDFTEDDRADTRPVVLVDRFVAEQVWPRSSAVGRELDITIPDLQDSSRARDVEVEVVGVVEHVRGQDVTREVRGQIYLPYRQLPMPDMTIVVRSGSEPERLAGAIRKEVRALDPDLPLFDVQTMEDYLEEALGATRFVLTALGVFSVAALLLASLGLYGVLSHLVRLRRSEIGLRMAFGADRASIFRLVVGQALSLVGAGIGLGVALAIVLAGWLESFLFGVSPRDPLTFVTLSFVLGAVAFVAAGVPALRAARLDPVRTLRAEG